MKKKKNSPSSDAVSTPDISCTSPTTKWKDMQVSDK